MKILQKMYKSFELNCVEKGENYLLKLTMPENKKGIIYRVTAVLFAHGWDILEANFEIIGGGMVKDVFIIRNLNQNPMRDENLMRIKDDLYSLFSEEISVIDYLDQFPDLPLLKPSSSPPSIQIFNPISSDSTVLDIKTQDRPGLLFEISQILYLLDIDILSVTARTEDGIIRDSFILREDSAKRLSAEKMDKIKIGLSGIL